MLHQITWQQYLLVVTAASLVYYVIIWLLYSREGTGKSDLKLSGQPKEQLNDNEAAQENLLGEPAEEYGVSTLYSDELNFGPDAMEEEVFGEEPGEKPAATTGLTDSDQLLQGDIADLLEDIKPVFDLIEEQEPENRDRLIGLIVSKIKAYPGILQSDLLEPVLQEICDNSLSELGLEISPDELKAAII